MANKRSKKKGKKYFYLCIISMVKKENRLPKHINKQKLNYYVKTLKTNNIIEKKGYGTWEITKLGEQYLRQEEVKTFNQDALVQPDTLGTRKLKSKLKKIRGHGYMWQIKTPLVKSKERIYKQLLHQKLNPVITETKQIKVFLLGHNVKIGNRAITVNFNPDLYYECKSAKDCHKMAVYDLKALIVRIERILGYSIKVKQKHQFRPCKKHFGDVNNAIAGRYHKDGKALQILDEGKEWLVIDFSDNAFIELETTDNSQNIVDMDHIITPFMNKLRREPKILDNVEEKLLRMEKIIERQNNIIDHLVTKSEASNIQRFI